jgi:uncharacterized membrane protein
MSAAELFFRFCVYGVLGWCGEILWTAITRRLRGEVNNWLLLGETSLWAFPMYGAAVFLFEPLHHLVRDANFLVRGLIYLAGFWTVEYIGGWVVWKITGDKPWDYSRSPGGSLNGLIRWNFFLVWPVIGLFAEQLHDLLVRVGPFVLAGK